MRRSGYMMAAGVLTIAAACERGADADSAKNASAVEQSGGAGGEAFPASPSPRSVSPGRPGSRTEATSSLDVAERAPAPPPAPGLMGDVSGINVQDPSAGGADRAAATPGSQTTSSTIVPSMLIRSGNAVVEVDSLEIAVAAVRLLAARVGGYVANTSMQSGAEELRSAQIELKIPAARFDEAVAGLQPLGKVEAVNVTTEDVGEEFVDVEARVANARRLEQRLVTLLATRTGRLEDVLHVERELARVREEIERYEGRLRYLRTRAAVSTLVVTVHEPQPIVGRYGGQNPIAEAFRAMWRNLVAFVAGLIAALGWLLPLALLLAGAWWLLRRAGLFHRRHDDGVRLPRTARVPHAPVERLPEEPASRDPDAQR